METLLEIRDRARDIYSKNEIFLLPIIRFILAFIIFGLINKNIGYMQRLDTMLVPLVLALICSILTVNAMIFFSVLLILAHLYALSPEVCLMALIIFLIIGLLYFRFAPKDGIYTILTPVCFFYKIPYIIPVSQGIISKPYAVFSMISGTIVYFFLDGVKINSALLGAKGDDETSMTSKFVSVINQLLGNKEMYLAVVVLSVTALVVYSIHSLSMDHAWSIAIVIGILVQFTGFFAGYILIGIHGRMLNLVLGSIASALIAFLLKFFVFHVDYSRTERVQFEDDEYYYYVKAIPKISVTKSKKQVTKFNSKTDSEIHIEDFEEK